jgi:RNA 2',3'-cyclic 3'-phosphodiesterase
MLESTRVFIAIAIPKSLGQKLAQLQTELAPAAPEFRWASALPFHLTLAFLGEIPNLDLNAIGQIAAESARPIEPFELEVKGLGAFPSPSRPRVIWAGVTAPNLNPLFDLQGSLASSLERIGHPPDDRRFNPHVTLGHRKHGRGGSGNLTGLVERYRLWSAGQFRVADVQVFASTPGRAGSVYTVLSEATLVGKKTEGHA